MRFIPGLFNTEIVQSILEDRKTNMRRIAKVQPGDGEYYEKLGENDFAYISNGGMFGPYKCPYGQPGDIIWVRETFGYNYFNNKVLVYKAGPFPKHYSPHLHKNDKRFLKDEKWRPNIHMPKEFCRIFLKVKSVRVERLQDISEEDAKSEGVSFMDFPGGRFYRAYWGEDVFVEMSAKDSFLTLWQSINGS